VRFALRQRYTDSAIDDLLAPERITYEDLALAAAEPTGGGACSILKTFFENATGDAAIALCESLIAQQALTDAQALLDRSEREPGNSRVQVQHLFRLRGLLLAAKGQSAGAAAVRRAAGVRQVDLCASGPTADRDASPDA
jgi:hypothetical protein